MQGGLILSILVACVPGKLNELGNSNSTSEAVISQTLV